MSFLTAAVVVAVAGRVVVLIKKYIIAAVAAVAVAAAAALLLLRLSICPSVLQPVCLSVLPLSVCLSARLLCHSSVNFIDM